MVRVTLDGIPQLFHITGEKDGVIEIHQNEGLFTREFVEAVRKLRRWPKNDNDEQLGENSRGTPCFVTGFCRSPVSNVRSPSETQKLIQNAKKLRIQVKELGIIDPRGSCQETPFAAIGRLSELIRKHHRRLG